MNMFKLLALKPFRSQAKGFCDLLNYAVVVDSGVVQGKDGSLLAGYWYRGPDTVSASPEELDVLSRQVCRALSLFGTGWSLWIEAIRAPATGYPDRQRSHFPDVVSALIEEERRATFEGGQEHFFETRYAVFLAYMPPSKTTRRAVDLLYDNSGDGRLVDAKTYMNRLVEGFQQHLNRFEDAMSRAVQLQRMEGEIGIAHGSDREVWSEDLVNALYCCVSGRELALNLPSEGAYLDSLFAVDDLIGGERPRLGDDHILVVSVHGFPPYSTPDVLGMLDRQPYPYRLSTRFIPRDAVEVRRDLDGFRKKWGAKSRGLMDQLQGTSKGPVSESDLMRASEASEALSKADEGSVTFGYYTLVIVLRGPDYGLLELRGREVVGLLGKMGFAARIEKLNTIEAWLGSLPGHTFYDVRRPLIHTGNLADLLPLSSVWPGRSTHPCPFYPPDSPPLMQAATDGSTPFRFSLHVGDVGHTTIIGPTGAGKSVLLAAIMAQHMRYKHAQVVCFDKGMSAYALCKALSGRHYELGVDGGAAFAPLADLPTEADQAWGAEYVETLFQLQTGRPATPRQRSEIYRAVAHLQTDSGRSLTDFVATVQDQTVKEALQFYTLGGAAGALLDARADSAELGRFTVFEIEELMGMGAKSMLAVFAYIEFQIRRRLLDGKPTLLVIDEAWLMLREPAWRDKIVEWLKVLRKANAAVVLSTQSLSDLERSGILAHIGENVATRIYLANPDATRGGMDGAPGPRDFYSVMGCTLGDAGVIAGLTRKREYYVASPEGRRVMDLALGPVALSFLAVSDKPTIARIKELEARDGKQWPFAWLRERGVEYERLLRQVEEHHA